MDLKQQFKIWKIKDCHFQYQQTNIAIYNSMYTYMYVYGNSNVCNRDIWISYLFMESIYNKVI